jgi:PAS domain S-box-containing protein
MRKGKHHKIRCHLGTLTDSHFENIFNNFEGIIYLVDKKGFFTYLNKYVEKISHYKADEIIGCHFSKFIAPESLKIAAKAFVKRIRAKKFQPHELVLLDKTEEKVYVKTSGCPIRENNRIVGLLGFAVDITKHKKDVENLSKMVKELTLLYDIGKELTSIIDLDLLFSRILLCLSNAFGYERTGILMIDEITNKLAIKATTKPFADWEKSRLIELGQGITGHVAKTGKPYLSNDVSKDTRYITFDKNTKSEVAVPLKLGNKLIGVINVERYKKDAFDKDDIRILTLVANQAAVAIENSGLYKSLEDSYLDTIKALVSAMEAKDHYTRGHSERVRMYALKVANELRLNEEESRDLNYAGFLHDIGKIGVTDYLLTKVEPLTKEEYETIKQHPDIGYSILKDVKHLKGTCEIIKCEHERYDGSGYPNGLMKNAIPIGARIIAVVDAYDAMTTDRPYQKAILKKDAINRLKQHSGTQFDPKVVRAFLKILKKEKNI